MADYHCKTRPYREIAGAVYLLHAERPIGAGARGRAQHYTGFAELLDDMASDREALVERIGEHGTPAGAKIMQAFARAGVRWIVAGTIRGVTKAHEAYLKKQYKNAARFCPVCGGLVSFEEIAGLELVDQVDQAIELPVAATIRIRPAAILEETVDQVDDDAAWAAIEASPAPAGRMDYYEYSTIRRWREAAAPSSPSAERLEELDDLL